MHRRATLAIAVLMVLAVHAWLIAIEVNPLRGQGSWNQLWDPDSYTRLSRVLELHEHGGWHDPTFRGANHPSGFALHWSRFLDVLLYVPARLLSVVLPFERALFLWAVVLAPALHVAAVLLMSWGTRRFLRDGQFLLLAAFLSTQRGVSYDFLPGLVDHHLLQVFLLLAAVAALVRAPHSRRGELIAGIAVGLAVWASVESVVIAIALGGALSLAWMVEGSLAAAVSVLRFGGAAAVTAATALLAERPLRAILDPSYERLSVIQVGLLAGIAAIGALLAVAVRRLRPTTAWTRVAFAAAVGVVTGGILLVAFPELARNPYLTTADVIQARLLPYIAAEQRFLPTTAASAYNFVLEIGPPLLAILFGAWAILRGGAEADERHRLLVTCGATAAFVAYAVYAYRGLPFVSAAGAIPWTEGVSRLWRSVRGAGSGRDRWSRLPAAMGATAGHWTAAALIAFLWLPGIGWKNLPACRWDELASAVPALSEARRGGAVLADVFAGPEIHYRTGRPVIGSPYHGNGDGVAATYRMFGSTPAAAAGELGARDVDWIALCGGTTADLIQHIRSQPWGLGSRVLMGMAPTGFSRVALPPELTGRFLLFRRVTTAPPAQ